MSSARKLATLAGTLYLITHLTSIGGLALYGPVLNDPGYPLGPGADTRVLLGAFLEGVLALAVVGTAVTLFPVVKRRNEGVALGYVGLRVLEAALIGAGIVSLLAVVTLRRDLAGATDTDAAALAAAGQALVAFHDWALLLGPSFVLGVSTTLLAYLMYRSELVPRIITLLGLVGGPLIFASAILVMFDVYEQVSAWGAITALPVFAWEVSLGVWLVVKGFRPLARADTRVSSATA
jgi:Domain of unknown function (DUF4386)